MAPSKAEYTFVAPAEYTALPIQFSEEQKAHHCLYAKEQQVTAGSEKNSVLVVNVPAYVTKECLSDIFSSCGDVESVTLLDKVEPSVKKHAEEYRYFNQQAIKGFQAANIVFKNSSGIQKFRSIKVWTPLIISKRDDFVKAGLHKWIEDYEKSFVDVVVLQTEIDKYMQEHDKKVATKEDKAKEKEGVPDEDGWITVTRKGRRPGIARTEAVNFRLTEKEKKKRAQKELLNFYAWQLRNKKKEHLAELRKKFEEDKQKIALMRAQRKFRPY
ncbi:ribosomal RNA-processing protein 7 homolog A [Ranitomeya variabilis]|uniref:ribosomal RNA-processing protein 7 homolog A n=1 Tax=Ranitomeya variabilis TaxID=490064 RepID=UPI004057BEF4